MSDKHKKERKRSPSSSSSYSSTSSESSDEDRSKPVSKGREKPSKIVPPVNVNKMRLDIGYKIQQEELSDSSDSEPSTPPLKTPAQSESIGKYSSVTNKTSRSKTPERRRYRSNSKEKRKERSRSRDSRKDRSRSKEIKNDHNSKRDVRGSNKRHRSNSKERKRERSRSRDRRKRRSRSRDRSHSRVKDKKKERSRSRDRKRERSRSKERDRAKQKRKDRSRSKEKRREKSHRDSQSPGYKDKKAHGHSKRDRSRERSSKRSRSRSRSRSRLHKRSRSRSRSFDKSKRAFDKKYNKLSILEKLGIELKVPEGHMLGEPGSNSSGFSIPSYYNPAGVNPIKYAQQMQKKRLIWGNKKPEGEASGEKKEVEEKSSHAQNAGPESLWQGTTFSQDQDGKLTAKFKRLMGIKGGDDKPTEKSSDLIQKQEEMFSSMEKQYEVARVSTHTHRGLGLGFGVHLPR